MHVQNSPIQNISIQNSPKNHIMKKKNQYKTVQFKVAGGRARRRFAAITGSKFRIKSHPLLTSSQHVGATAVVTILLFMFIEQNLTLFDVELRYF